MGRKLSSDEAEAFVNDATSLPNMKVEVPSSYAPALQSRIAEALGLSVADLLHRSASGIDTQEAAHEGQAAEMALTQDCLDLIEAFTRVEDPEERQRLLKMVRDAARMNKHEEPGGSQPDLKAGVTPLGPADDRS
jgi:hypothetical protein